MKLTYFRVAGFSWMAVIFLMCFNWAFYMTLIHKSTEQLVEHIQYGLMPLGGLIVVALIFGAGQHLELTVYKTKLTVKQNWGYFGVFLLLNGMCAWMMGNIMLGLAEYYQNGFVDIYN